MGATADISDWLSGTLDRPSSRANRVATHALLDWAGVTLAGAGEPLVDLLVRDSVEECGSGTVSLVGRLERLNAGSAARVMGAASHALDFDDVNTRMRGHPSVAILPALLAADCKRDGAALIEALVVGTEVACVLGEMLGAAHYERGFHATATIGTVGAAAGVCRLLGVDAEVTRRALSLAATQASGLRAMFGTMAKPLHAGLAAENGLRAARWALAGMTAPDDGLETVLGFGPVLSASFASLPIRPDKAAPFGIELNVFKRHAACYYTHSAIDAAAALALRENLTAEDIRSVTVGLQPTLLTVCDIPAPATGLEVKFSVRHLVATALLGHDTTDPDIYTATLAADPEIAALRQRVTAVPLQTSNRMEAEVAIIRTDGKRFETRMDISKPAKDLDAQELLLSCKFERLATPLLGERAPAAARTLLAAEDAAAVTNILDALVPES